MPVLVYKQKQLFHWQCGAPELNLVLKSMADHVVVDDVHDSDVAVHSDNDLAVTNLHAPLKVGNEHNFYEELEKAIKALEKVQNINLWIRDSRSITAAK